MAEPSETNPAPKPAGPFRRSVLIAVILAIIIILGGGILMRMRSIDYDSLCHLELYLDRRTECLMPAAANGLDTALERALINRYQPICAGLPGNCVLETQVNILVSRDECDSMVAHLSGEQNTRGVLHDIFEHARCTIR